jgi:hypothetical protein
MNIRVLLAICVAIALIAPRAQGQSADALKKAQSSFDQAQLDYLQGKYDEAAAGFQAAYDARPFPQFIYNIAASHHMKAKKNSDIASYKKAVELYKRYLSEDPNAADKPKVDKTIVVLEAEIKRLEDAAKANAGAGSGSGSGSATAPPAGPSQEVQQLGDVKVHGLVVIDTNIRDVTIYLDDPHGKPFATTPWSGELEGTHKVYFEKRGYAPSEGTISADPSKLFVLNHDMAQDTHQAWVDVTANVKAQVHIDDKNVAPFEVPLSRPMSPGKHTFYVTAEGYDEYSETVDIAAGQNYTVKATLKGSPLGKLDVVGAGIEDATILVDGKVLCDHGPCIKSVPEGDHQVTVMRPDYKTYSKRVLVQAKSETTVKVLLQPQPGRGDAIAAYIVTAVFGGAGIYCGLQASKLHDDLQKGIAAGNPPVDSNDPRILKGKIYAISADAGFAIAGITALTALYYTFREKGAPSTATVDVRALALQPQIGSHYAGLGMEVHW